MQQLEIKNLFVNVGDKEILSGIDLVIKKGEIHAIMGPNGSGKSSLANAIMGHPKYKVMSGKILVDGQDVTNLPPNKRAEAGLFLSMQHSPEITGVTVNNFLRNSAESLAKEKYNPIKFYNNLIEKMKQTGVNPDFVKRYLNVGFSGGEKKQMEIIHLLTIQSSYAILDEIDSGLDVDALKMVSVAIKNYHNKDNAVLLITHYNRILHEVQPDFVHIMKKGKIVESGSHKLALQIEAKGYNN